MRACACACVCACVRVCVGGRGDGDGQDTHIRGSSVGVKKKKCKSHANPCLLNF